MGNITDSVLGGDSLLGTVQQRVHFRVDRGDTVAVAHGVTYVVAVGVARYGTVVAGGDDAVVFVYQNATYKGSVAGRSTGDYFGDLHKIGVPRFSQSKPPFVKYST